MDGSKNEEFAEFVRAQESSLFRAAYLLTGDYQRAEDVLQSALMSAYLHWDRVRIVEQPGAYVRRIVINQATSWWRRRSSREVASLRADDRSVPGHEDAVAEHARLWAAVRRLPPRQRAVVVLRFYEDLSEAETAAALGVSVGTVKRHGHEARARLGLWLGAAEESEVDRVGDVTGGER